MFLPAQQRTLLLPATCDQGPRLPAYRARLALCADGHVALAEAAVALGLDKAKLDGSAIVLNDRLTAHAQLLHLLQGYTGRERARRQHRERGRLASLLQGCRRWPRLLRQLGRVRHLDPCRRCEGKLARVHAFVYRDLLHRRFELTQVAGVDQCLERQVALLRNPEPCFDQASHLHLLRRLGLRRQLDLPGVHLRDRLMLRDDRHVRAVEQLLQLFLHTHHLRRRILRADVALLEILELARDDLMLLGTIEPERLAVVDKLCPFHLSLRCIEHLKMRLRDRLTRCIGLAALTHPRFDDEAAILLGAGRNHLDNGVRIVRLLARLLQPVHDLLSGNGFTFPTARKRQGHHHRYTDPPKESHDCLHTPKSETSIRWSVAREVPAAAF